VSEIRVAALFVHPIKSAAPIAVDFLDLDDRGARGDRRWVLVDGNDRALTQRDHHRLALVRPSFASPDRNGALRVDAPGMETLSLDTDENADIRSVSIWDDVTLGDDAGDDAAAWMSEAIGSTCRVMRLSSDARRPLQQKYVGDLPNGGRHVAFTDGSPLLILGQASIDALNARLTAHAEAPVPVNRFRPNVLLEGLAAHEEDEWTMVQIGAMPVGVGQPCPRCVVTTIDQETLEQGHQPLRMFATYRRMGSEVVFAMNATHAHPGSIHVGDEVRVVRRR
jgi:uncharacterized protein